MLQIMRLANTIDRAAEAFRMEVCFMITPLQLVLNVDE